MIMRPLRGQAAARTPPRDARALRLLLVNEIAGSYWMPKRLRVRIYRSVGFAVPDDCAIFSGVIIRAEQVQIGRGVFINHNCVFDDGPITLGENVYLGVGTVLASSDHDVGPSSQRAGQSRIEPIVIESGCWLGAGVVVLAGVRIRSGCIVGAGAVVTRDTEPNGVYTGVPARRTRELDSG